MALSKRSRYGLTLAVLTLLIPIRLAFLNEWTVRVHDENGLPLPNINVDESWDSYTFDMHDYQSLRTDFSGTVTFPRVTPWRPFGLWAARTIRVFLNVHGSWGHSSGAVRIFDDAVESAPGIGAGSDVCSNPDCVGLSRTSDFRVYLADRSESATRNSLEANREAFEAIAEDWMREQPAIYFANSQNGDYSWGPWEIYPWLQGFEVLNRDNASIKFKVGSLEEAASVMGRDGQPFLVWLKRAQSLGINSIRIDEGSAIQIRLLPGAHGLYYVPRQTEGEARAYLTSLGPTGDRELKLGVMKQFSDRWFYFADFAPGTRLR